MTNAFPLISCICVTNSRPTLLKRAIDCFVAQNYPNKQLVVSHPEGDDLTPELINTIYGALNLNVTILQRRNGESVGNARNEAILKAKGNYICVWDDDDWYHPLRLLYQYESLTIHGDNLNASVLSRIILLDKVTDKAYMSFSYCWENTLLCRKEILLQNQYTNSNKAEDTHIIKFLDGKKFLYNVADKPYLYIYIYHGQNTWDYKHYQHLIGKSELLDQSTTNKILELV